MLLSIARPMTNPPRPCVDGTYHCRCGNWSHDSPCPEAVGEVDIRSMFDRIHPSSPGSSWMVNLAVRTGGRWYSTVDRGECGNPEATACRWAAGATIKTVSAACQAAKVRAAVEAAGHGCFAALPVPIKPESFGYVRCYYDTLLGPAAADTFPAPTGCGKGCGMPGKEIVDIWDHAFEACPAL